MPQSLLDQMLRLVLVSLALAAVGSGVQAQSKSVAAPPAQDARRAELLHLNAEIERRLQQEGGRVRYLAPATEEEPFKSYYQRFVKRMEALGAASFPKKDGKSVYGNVLALVYVDSDGRIQAVHIARADSKILEKHAAGTLRSAIPLEPFSPEMKSLADRVVMSASFRYFKD